MKIGLPQPRPTKPSDWPLVGPIWQRVTEIVHVINASLGFGDGTLPDNIAGEWIEYSTNSTPDTEDAISHTLGVIPVGFILMVPPGSGTINLGSTSWTESTIYLQCSAASQTCKIFLLPPPRE